MAMNADEMVEATPQVPERRSLLADLDMGPPSKRGAILLLVAAALLAWTWLGGTLLRSLLAPIVSGPGAVQIRTHTAQVRAEELIGIVLVALAVGVLAGAAVRRWKWLVAPCLIMVAVAAVAAPAWSHLTSQVPLTYNNGTTFSGYQLQFGLKAGLYLGSALLFGALGGLLAARISRRVHLSLLTSGALAWVGVVLLWTLFLQGALKFVPGYSGTWSSGALAWKAAETLPYFLLALWMVWATRRRGMWTAALIAGSVAVFQVLTGYMRISTGNALRTVLSSAHWALRGLASTSVGAWVGVAVFREEPRRKLARDAVIVAGIILAIAIVAWLAEKQPSGFAPLSRVSPSSQGVISQTK